MTNPFQRSRPAAPKARPAANKPANKWAGVKAEAPRTPLFPYGLFKVRVTDSGELPPVAGRDTYHEVVCEILAVAEGDAAPGQIYAMINPTSGKAGTNGLGRVKAFLVAACGHETEDAFDAAPYEDGDEIGRCVVVRVTQGNERVVDGVPTGDHYRVHAWQACGDEDQE